MPEPTTNTPDAQASLARPPRFSDTRRAAVVKAAYLLDLARR